jgi:Fe-S-cluster containining protein
MNPKAPFSRLSRTKTNLKSALKTKPASNSLGQTKTKSAIKPKSKILKRKSKKTEVNFPVTQQLASVLDELSFEQQSQVGEALVKTMTGLKKIQKEKRAEFIYSQIDKAMVVDKKDKEKVTCKKGCSHCCQQMVFVTDDEANLLLPLLLKENETLSPQTLDYLTEQSKYDTGTIFDFWKLPKEKSSCVFLKDNVCTIYPKRPNACRTLQVTSKPDNCSKDKPIHTEIQKKVNLDAEIWAAAALGMPKTVTDTMPKIILKKYRELIIEREKQKSRDITTLE